MYIVESLVFNGMFSAALYVWSTATPRVVACYPEVLPSVAGHFDLLQFLDSNFVHVSASVVR